MAKIKIFQSKTVDDCIADTQEKINTFIADKKVISISVAGESNVSWMMYLILYEDKTERTKEAIRKIDVNDNTKIQ